MRRTVSASAGEPPAGAGADGGAGDGSSRERDRQRALGVVARQLSRGIGSPVLFAIVWTSLASAIYFSLGVVADHALGLTPLVFLLAAVMFALDRADLRRGRVAAPGTAAARPCSRATRSTSS